MLALIVSLKVKPDQRDRFLAAAEDDSICSVRDEPGCLRFDVLQDQSDQNHFFFHEVYRDDEAFQAHQQTPHFRRWREAAGQVLDGPTDREVCNVLFPKDYK
jgi:(4S)-4-hydroxy-5-phosphonooxypentane-2,3-dione isomerase